MNTNKILSVATMLMLGTAMQVSVAEGMTSPYKIGLESADVGSSGTFAIGDTTKSFTVPVISGRIIENTTPYFVIVTLTGGAKFGGTKVALECGYSATVDIGNAAGVAEVDSPAAATSGAIASFKLQSANGNGALTGCQLTWAADSGIHLTSGNKDYGISVTNRHMDNSDPVSATKPGNIVTFTQAAQASISAGSVTIDVVSPSLSKTFLEAGSVVAAADAGQADNVANLGVIRYTPATDVYDLAGAAVARDTYLKDATLVVSGSVVAGAVSASSGSTTVTGFIYLSSTASCSANAAKGAIDTTDTTLVANASGNQVSFVVSAADFKGSDTSGLKVCMLPNGIATLEKGSVSFTLTVKSPTNTGDKPNLTITDTILTTVVKNGTSVKVLNIPPPDYTTDVAYVRFYNMGSVAGKIYGTLYSQGKTDGTNEGGGTPIGTPNTLLIDSLAPGQVIALSGPAIGSKFGATTWPGRAWLQVESEVKGLRVQALVRSGGAGGTLTNMSDRVMADGEKFQRNE